MAIPFASLRDRALIASSPFGLDSLRETRLRPSAFALRVSIPIAVGRYRSLLVATLRFAPPHSLLRPSGSTRFARRSLRGRATARILHEHRFPVRRPVSLRVRFVVALRLLLARLRDTLAPPWGMLIVSLSMRSNPCRNGSVSIPKDSCLLCSLRSLSLRCYPQWLHYASLHYALEDALRNYLCLRFASSPFGLDMLRMTLRY